MVDLQIITKTLLLILCFFGLNTCASKNDLKIEYPKTLDELVTVKTAVNMAHNAYLNACIKNSMKPKGERFKRCSSLAKEYIAQDVVFILNSDGKGQ